MEQGNGERVGGSGKIKEFSDLRVWQAGKELIKFIYELTKGFPKSENYGLTDQMRRASGSICANIAEGFSRYHAKDKIRFYHQARGSVSECKNHVIIASELGYLSADKLGAIVELLEDVKMMLNGLINSVNRLHRIREAGSGKRVEGFKIPSPASRIPFPASRFPFPVPPHPIPLPKPCIKKIKSARTERGRGALSRVNRGIAPSGIPSLLAMSLSNGRGANRIACYKMSRGVNFYQNCYLLVPSEVEV